MLPVRQLAAAISMLNTLSLLASEVIACCRARSHPRPLALPDDGGGMAHRRGIILLLGRRAHHLCRRYKLLAIDDAKCIYKLSISPVKMRWLAAAGGLSYRPHGVNGGGPIVGARKYKIINVNRSSSIGCASGIST